jgi:hypothetical protein
MVISVDGNTLPVTNTYLTHKIWRYGMDSTGSEECPLTEFYKNCKNLRNPRNSEISTLNSAQERNEDRRSLTPLPSKYHPLQAYPLTLAVVPSLLGNLSLLLEEKCGLSPVAMGGGEEGAGI